MLSPAPQYRCNNLKRARLLAADATFDDISSVELLTDDALAPRQDGLHPNDVDLRARVLLFHLPNPVDTSGPNLLVQNGILITDLSVAWADSAGHLVSSNAAVITSADERAQVQSQLFPLLPPPADQANVLVVRTSNVVFNGIDFLEVVDGQIDQSSGLRQQVLFVHLFLPVPAEITDRNETVNGNTTLVKGSQNLLIQGGVRIVDPQIDWAQSATELVNGGVSLIPLEQQGDVQSEIVDKLLAPLDADTQGHILVVHTVASGDYSPYEFSIIDEASQDEDGFNPPFFGFDSQLSRVTFSFKVDCPSDFDCLTAEVCPPETPQAPIIDYLAKDWASFRTLMLNRMAQTMPQWTERSVADIGVTLVELLAYAADQLSYFQDAVANEAYLGTARRRPSLRRHARLLDYTPREGTNARTFVHLEVSEVSPADTPVTGSLLPAHTALLSKTAGLSETVVSETDLEAALLAGSQVFETMEPVTLLAPHNQIPFYTWGDDDCCLPAGAVRATLQNGGAGSNTVLLLTPGAPGAIAPGALLAFVEINSPDSTSAGVPPDPKHRQVVRLTKVRPGFDPLTNTNVVDIEWSADDALTFPLCLNILQDGSPVSVAQGNIVLADHGHSVTEDLPPPSSVAGNQRYLPPLTEGPITFQAQVQDADQNLLLFDPTASATAALTAGDPRLAIPDVTLFPIPAPDDGTRDCDPTQRNRWTAVSDLLESGPFSQSFVVEMENDGTAQLRFGDDQLGRTPTETLFACYRIGSGTAGNIGADGLQHIVTSVEGIESVSNVLPAVGGTDPEPLVEIRLSAPQAFRVQERAVTEADYGDVALRFPGIQRAVATRRFTGSWYTMFVAVDRVGGAAVDDDFKATFAAFLERFRLAGYDLEIQGSIPVPLLIRLTICVKPGFFRADVKKALLDALGDHDLPGGGRGFFHPDNFTFGQPVFLSQIVAAALAVAGVGSIDTSGTNLLFQRLREAPDVNSPPGVLTMQRLEIAQLDNDPSQPENGTLELVMQGGS